MRTSGKKKMLMMAKYVDVNEIGMSVLHVCVCVTGLHLRIQSHPRSGSF